MGKSSSGLKYKKYATATDEKKMTKKDAMGAMVKVLKDVLVRRR